MDRCYLAISPCDPLFTPTYKAFHYHSGPFHPVMGPFYPPRAPPPPVGGFGWSAHALVSANFRGTSGKMGMISRKKIGREILRDPEVGLGSSHAQRTDISPQHVWTEKGGRVYGRTNIWSRAK